jgi:hypothetical protein
MKPSVGRIVHFGQPTYTSEPDGVVAWAAIVTWVHEDGSVNLRVFHPSAFANADQHHERVKESETLEAARWSWPPRVP